MNRNSDHCRDNQRLQETHSAGLEDGKVLDGA